MISQVPDNLSKKELRVVCKNIRDGLSLDERETISARIWDKLYTLDGYKKASNLLVYASIGSELDTKPLIERALAESKRVYIPKVIGNEIEFFRLESLADLTPTGSYKILEPTAGETPNFNEDTIMIVPALAVDKRGYRLGYGGGFYDRYLKKCKETVKSDKIFTICGIFPSLFINSLPNSLPISDYDIPIDMIITEHEIIIV
jgi:5-formyltetrahydrofolate cyclo-ligase